MNVLLETFITCEENTEKRHKSEELCPIGTYLSMETWRRSRSYPSGEERKCIPRRKTRICLCHWVPRMLPHLSKDILDICRAFLVSMREHAGQGQPGSSVSHRFLVKPYTCEWLLRYKLWIFSHSRMKYE